MNNSSPHSSTSSGTQAPAAWLVALILFLTGLAWAVSSGIQANTQDGARSGPAASGANGQAGPLLLGRANPGTIFDRLPAPGTVQLPAPLSDAERTKSAPVKNNAGEAEYILAGAGLQGLYQNSAPDDVWTLDYPAPRLDAQLIRRGPPYPLLVTGGVSVTWELAPPNGQGKDAARQGRMQATEDSWSQASIPLNELRAATSGSSEPGTFNPYPVLTLRAVDAAGKLLAESSAVLAVAPEFGCSHCHDNAGTAILEEHDRHQSTNLMRRHARGEVVACRSCHDGLNVRDGKEHAGKGLSVSAAVHGWHAPFLTDMSANACMTCHTAQGRSAGNPGERPQALFARDFHVQRGLDCARCHGVMEDHSLALLKAEQEAGQRLAAPAMAAITPRAMPVAEMDGRLPWIQEPDCTSCHNFSEKPNPRTASAFNKWTPADEGASGLFSERRDDMFIVRCIVCHGAPHAVYPARNPLVDNLDNIPPMQYQNLAATLGSGGNCVICHGQPMDFSAHHPLVEQQTAN